MVASYTYDAWGNILSANGTLAQTNPFRYRGYYYDTETKLYYLQSRYYNPQIGRFLNTDVLYSTGGLLGHNMFAYCFNNPTNLHDPTGNWPEWLDEAIEWVEENIVEPTMDVIDDIGEDIASFSWSNTSEETVIDSNYFSFYKGKLVIRTDLDRSGSFGVLFISRNVFEHEKPEDEVRHEYGHTKQLDQLGALNYVLCIFIPSCLEWGSDEEYYRRPWEITADIYGGVQSRSYPGHETAGFDYLVGSLLFGPLAWLAIE